MGKHQGAVKGPRGDPACVVRCRRMARWPCALVSALPGCPRQDQPLARERGWPTSMWSGVQCSTLRNAHGLESFLRFILETIQIGTLKMYGEPRILLLTPQCRAVVGNPGMMRQHCTAQRSRRTAHAWLSQPCLASAHSCLLRPAPGQKEATPGRHPCNPSAQRPIIPVAICPAALRPCRLVPSCRAASAPPPGATPEPPIRCLDAVSAQASAWLEP